MIACDNFMNITLRDVILTAPDGDKFYQMKEVYLKGNVVSIFSLSAWLVGRCFGGCYRCGCAHSTEEDGLRVVYITAMPRAKVGEEFENPHC